MSSPLNDLELTIAYELESYAKSDFLNANNRVSSAYNSLSLHNENVAYPKEGNYYSSMLKVLEEHLAYCIQEKDKALSAYLSRKKVTESIYQKCKRTGSIC